MAIVGFLAFAGVVTALIVWGVRYSKRVEQERIAALTAAAERLGWTYRAEVPFNAVPDLDRFELFKQGGRSRKLKHLMTSPAGDVRAVLFDFSYVVSTGKSTATVQQTVLYLTSDALDLPTFSVRPENFMHGIATALGYQDIDIEQRPTFSEKFLLRGKDEARIREVFSHSVCEFFEQHAGVCAAGDKHELLYWRAAKLVKPDEIDALVSAGDELAARFADATQSHR